MRTLSAWKIGDAARSWRHALPEVIFAMDSQQHSRTECTPYQVVFKQFVAHHSLRPQVRSTARIIDQNSGQIEPVGTNTIPDDTIQPPPSPNVLRPISDMGNTSESSHPTVALERYSEITPVTDDDTPHTPPNPPYSPRPSRTGANHNSPTTPQNTDTATSTTTHRTATPQTHPFPAPAAPSAAVNENTLRRGQFGLTVDPGFQNRNSMIYMLKHG
ncbi:hypothetical protein DFP73DRAFT_614585 [Morchella snyderi]|nr:hypothetical protein DFP73DRAFT_614585 [Morchella snyderi]